MDIISGRTTGKVKRQAEWRHRERQPGRSHHEVTSRVVPQARSLHGFCDYYPKQSQGICQGAAWTAPAQPDRVCTSPAGCLTASNSQRSKPSFRLYMADLCGNGIFQHHQTPSLSKRSCFQVNVLSPSFATGCWEQTLLPGVSSYFKYLLHHTVGKYEQSRYLFDSLLETHRHLFTLKW